MMETLRNKFHSLPHPRQAIFVGGLVGLVPAVLLATVEGLWLMVPPAVLAAGLVTGAVWLVGFGNEPFSVSRSIVLGVVASLLSCIAIWGVAALFVAINLGDSRFGFAMLVLGTLGLSIVVPLFLPFGVIATLLLRRSQCSRQRHAPVP